MIASFARLERTLFRALNAVVEPAVRKGFGSHTLAPASLIVLETTGFRSGERRRTPLWSASVGPYRLLGTARGRRSFWVKNLVKQPRIHYYIGGRRRAADAIVLADGSCRGHVKALAPGARERLARLAKGVRGGWVVVILAPRRIAEGKATAPGRRRRRPT